METPLCECGCGKHVGTGERPSRRPRFLRGHNRSRKDPEERFRKFYVEGDPDDCWLWLGGTASKGYGHFSMGGRGGKQVNAHRAAYEFHYGPIPEGMLVCHSCDNPPCVNWNHLFLGTHQDNVRDMWAKGRGYSYFQTNKGR